MELITNLAFEKFHSGSNNADTVTKILGSRSLRSEKTESLTLRKGLCDPTTKLSRLTPIG